MANTVSLTTNTSASLLTTQLNSLSDGAYTAVGAEFDNATSLAVFMDLVLTVTFASAPDAGGYCELFLLPAIDGTNYASGSASIVPSPTTLAGIFPLRADTNAHIITIPKIVLQPVKYKAILHNVSGQAFPASGSTVVGYHYGSQIVVS